MTLAIKTSYYWKSGAEHPRYKGGRDRPLPRTKISSDELYKLNEVLLYKKQNFTDWVISKINEDFDKSTSRF